MDSELVDAATSEQLYNIGVALSPHLDVDPYEQAIRLDEVVSGLISLHVNEFNYQCQVEVPRGRSQLDPWSKQNHQPVHPEEWYRQGLVMTMHDGTSPFQNPDGPSTTFFHGTTSKA